MYWQFSRVRASDSMPANRLWSNWYVLQTKIARAGWKLQLNISWSQFIALSLQDIRESNCSLNNMSKTSCDRSLYMPVSFCWSGQLLAIITYKLDQILCRSSERSGFVSLGIKWPLLTACPILLHSSAAITAPILSQIVSESIPAQQNYKECPAA